MKPVLSLLSLLLVCAFPTPPYAQEVEHKMGQHPAVLVKRQAAPGYDYQAQFYPHPAWLYLETDRHEMGDHPAVIVARRAARQAQAAQQATVHQPDAPLALAPRRVSPAAQR